MGDITIVVHSGIHHCLYVVLFCVMLFCLCECVFLFACWLVGLFVCVSKNNFSFQNNDKYLF